MKVLRQSLVVFVALTLLTGVVYPLAITCRSGSVSPPGEREPHRCAARVAGTDATRSLESRFVSSPRRSPGSTKSVGSELIGQQFTDAQYFWSRPSAAGYNGAASTGSNFGPTNPAQLDAVKQRVADSKAAHPGEGRVPVDLVTASGSGLDPHISPAAAEYQVESRG